MLDRKFLVKELIRYELERLIDNPEGLPEYVEFFFNGGFSRWTTDALQKKYDLFIKEDEQ
jgi:hypothetical protein